MIKQISNILLLMLENNYRNYNFLEGRSFLLISSAMCLMVNFFLSNFFFFLNWKKVTILLVSKEKSVLYTMYKKHIETYHDCSPHKNCWIPTMTSSAMSCKIKLLVYFYTHPQTYVFLYFRPLSFIHGKWWHSWPTSYMTFGDLLTILIHDTWWPPARPHTWHLVNSRPLYTWDLVTYRLPPYITLHDLSASLTHDTWWPLDHPHTWHLVALRPTSYMTLGSTCVMFAYKWYKDGVIGWSGNFIFGQLSW